jgi:hypothetical protein
MLVHYTLTMSEGVMERGLKRNASARRMRKESESEVVTWNALRVRGFRVGPFNKTGRSRMKRLWGEREVSESLFAIANDDLIARYNEWERDNESF